MIWVLLIVLASLWCLFVAIWVIGQWFKFIIYYAEQDALDLKYGKETSEIVEKK